MSFPSFATYWGVRYKKCCPRRSGHMANKFTILIEGYQNPSENDLAQYLLQKYRFFGKDKVTFYGKDEHSGDPVHLSFYVEEIGWVPKHTDQFCLTGSHALGDPQPLIKVEWYNFETRTGKLTYTLPTKVENVVQLDYALA